MVELQGQIVPTSEEEWQLLQDLYEVTGDASKAGIDTEEIVAVLNFVAVSISSYEGEEGLEAPDIPSDAKRKTCPECGEEMEDFTASLGGDVEIEPCGCQTTTEEIPGWVDV